MAFTAMETSATWLEVAHRAGTRFVFIGLFCILQCNFLTPRRRRRDHTHAPPPPPPPLSLAFLPSYKPPLAFGDVTSDTLPPTCPVVRFPPPAGQQLASILFRVHEGRPGDTRTAAWSNLQARIKQIKTVVHFWATHTNIIVQSFRGD